MKKLSFLLALLMPLSFLTACTPAIDTPVDTTDTAAQPDTNVADVPTETETEAETEETVPDTGYPVDLFQIGGVEFAQFSLRVQPDAAAGIGNVVESLIEYAEKATGHKLVVNEGEPAAHEIVVGMTEHEPDSVKAARDQIKGDGYAIVEDGGSLYITGNGTSGTVYGVNTFMENFLGVRFYATDYT